VQSRFGKVLLELGGNNAAIIMPDADLSLAVPAVYFGAVGTAGQRCTSTRRLYLHKSIADEFKARLLKLYNSPQTQPGDPLDRNTLLGPLHTPTAVGLFSHAMKNLCTAGAKVLTGGSSFESSALSSISPQLANGNFVQPTIVIPKEPESVTHNPIWRHETFAPILHVAEFEDLGEAIKWNNAVPQGLSSSLWTRDMRNVGKWIGPEGSDTGIVNVMSIYTGFTNALSYLISSLRLTWVRAAQRLALPLEAIRVQDGAYRAFESFGTIF
jgi:aldehyde dehydrogenase family 7 protein A1